MQQSGGAQTDGNSPAREFALRDSVQFGIECAEQGVRSRLISVFGSLK
jgi:hypothetical protein